MKIVKLAIIRENKEDGCPFGLNIPDGCKTVGKLIDQMIAIESVPEAERDTIAESNNRIFIYDNGQERCKCKYANVLFKSKVECNFGDFGAGKGHIDTTGSPLISSYIGGAFYSVPVGYYNQSLIDVWDNFMNRSFSSEDNSESIIKEAEEENK